MKHLSFFCTAAMALAALSANAGNRILFTENYESATGWQDTKWSSNANAAGLSVVSDDFGKYIQISAGANNQRSYNCNWTKAIYEGVDNTEYDIKFDFCVNAMGNNQYNSQLAIIAEDAVKAENGWTSSANKLFFFEQVKNADDAGILTYTINGNEADIWYPAIGTWYTFYLHVNQETRTVSYYAMDAAGSVAIPDGEYVLPETVTDMDASTLWYAHARYQNIVWFDNVTVYKDLGEGVDWANAPVVALTGLFNEERTYTIQFMEGETLHLTTTEGAEEVVEFEECETPGNYIYTTTTTGTLKAYTQVNDAISEEVVMDVVCGIYQLPEAVATIVAVNPGYSKTWQITIDKSTVPLQPNVVYDYVFTPADGSAVLSGEEMASGTNIAIPAEGVLTVTTKAYGYGSTSSEIINNVSYKIDQYVDFQHITADELAAKNFVAKENLVAASGGGESTWTSGGRLYFDWTNGTDTTRVFPFGHVVDGAYEGEGIVRMQFLQSGLTEEVASTMFAPVKVWYRGDGATCSINEDGTDMEDANGNKGGSVNVEVKIGVGLICPGIQGDEQTYDPAGAGYGNIRVANGPISIQGYDENAFVVVYKVQGYGNNANHGVIEASSEAEATAIWHEQGIGTYSEVYKGNEPFQLYRIDTAISRINVLVAAEAGIEEVAADAETAAKSAIFNLRGEKVQNLNEAGFFIQNGRVIMVK